MSNIMQFNAVAVRQVPEIAPALLYLLRSCSRPSMALDTGIPANMTVLAEASC